MKVGDRVKYFQKNQKHGLREHVANVVLIAPVGTVENFWEFQVLQWWGVQYFKGNAVGAILKGFVYQEDQDDRQKPELRVIDGGQKS